MTATTESGESCDLLVIGAGPAGMAAALAAAPSGARIVVIDDNPAPGGQIWRDGPGAQLPVAARRMRDALAACSNVRLCSATRVVAAPAPGTLLLEDAERGWHLQWNKLVLCTGARELLLPFPGWTLPGVTGAGGLQALIKSGLPVAGERIVVAGSGPLLLAVAATARHAGAQVLRIAEQTSAAALAGFAAQLLRWPGKAAQALSLLHPGLCTSAHVLAVHGQGRVESVQLQQGARRLDLACDRLACGFGLVPNTQLGQLLGCDLTPAAEGVQALRVDAWQATSLPNVYAAGECTGFGGSERALVQGAIAGHAALGQRDAAQQRWKERERWDGFARQLAHSFALGPQLKTLAQADTLVCRCEDVSYAAVAGCAGWRDAKLHSRCGMGACQGRVCGAATQFLFDWTSPAPRIPLTPARLGTLAALPGVQEASHERM
ncbi:NADPH-dependent 2,4-dienoyl-CoA reductase, sulfur reductase [Rhodoferax sp. OV413]|uniref:NAD(P)/FAD-dependent oxidoreductase n=1 Tax=Rhodoferax sp. OV413 TaxID=1855285 RepID=UPI00087FE102|nr:FAD/NAD(P)-binding oxidoreductase [Rhodoferax sp. OV413]SDO29243.1 NADPH-dependent 2,4-dienoyl-CoA reductase, sulfur reductase [Rhodoferax sp. OV413]